jgi:imidazolonepropionase-like amidohydrolase
MKRNACVAALLALLIATTAAAQDVPQAFIGAQIIPVSGASIDDGLLVVHQGRIVSVGTRDSVRLPPNAETHDVTGKWILPGLVDTHSHVGQVAGADASGPIQPDIRALDAVNVRAASIHKARAGGITTVNVMPGSGHLLSGQTLYLKLRDGRTVEDLAIRDSRGRITGGIKMANGTNPIRASPFPGTRARSAALMREQLVKAQEHRRKIERAKGDPEKLPERDLGLEALVEVLEGTRIVHFHTHRHDDILTALRLGREFGFKPVLHHVSEAARVANEIAAAGVPSSIIMIDSPGGKLEAMELRMHNAAALERAGAQVALHTDDGVTDSRFFLRSAGMAVRYGMSREAAIRALTIEGAKMLAMADRVGSLERGKDADFIVLSGDPLSTYTKVEQTWVEGKKVFDRSLTDDRLAAVGGWGAGHDQDGHLAMCGGEE